MWSACQRKDHKPLLPSLTMKHPPLPPALVKGINWVAKPYRCTLNPRLFLVSARATACLHLLSILPGPGKHGAYWCCTFSGTLVDFFQQELAGKKGPVVALLSNLFPTSAFSLMPLWLSSPRAAVFPLGYALGFFPYHLCTRLTRPAPTTPLPWVLLVPGGFLQVLNFLYEVGDLDLRISPQMSWSEEARHALIEELRQTNLAPWHLSCECVLRPAVFSTSLFWWRFVFTADGEHGQREEDPYIVVELLLLRGQLLRE